MPDRRRAVIKGGRGKKGDSKLNVSKKAKRVADKIGCGDLLARDLLALAGGDEDLVLRSSGEVMGIESVKALIIDGRFRKIEQES